MSTLAIKFEPLAVDVTFTFTQDAGNVNDNCTNISCHSGSGFTAPLAKVRKVVSDKLYKEVTP